MVRRLYLPFLGLFVWMFLSVVPTGQDATTLPASAGATITGSVIDGARTPLAGVTVALEQNGQTTAKTLSDADGKFRFTGVRPGTYQLRAMLTGFSPASREVVVQSATDTLNHAIVLTRSLEVDAANSSTQLDSVAVTNLPLNQYRNYEALVVLVPGTLPDASQPNAQSETPQRTITFTTNGQTTAAAQNLTDGAQNVNLWVEGGIRAEPPPYGQPYGTESYAGLRPNRFERTVDQPLSTFGADVDTASYTNVRRFLSNGQLPPAAAVRVEEFVNYFRFGYTEPRGRQPIALTTEVGDCPWAPGHKLVLIGARAKAPVHRKIESRNLVLLIDVSGSMAPSDKLPLIKSALSLFVETLEPNDRLAIVTYAGTTGVALPSTSMRNRDVIQRAIGALNAGGSTNGGQGLIVAYEMARRAFIPGGVNRVILATDGDFNVGIVNQRDLVSLIERERESGVFLSVFGVGTGNLKDSTMEMLADRGNGHYAYLDSLQEARRVLVREADATLETVAKDVKFQVEFNPAMVAAWRQIGYENRALAARDFNDDRKDAGEMGAGHTVTALYEVIPAGVVDSTDDGWLEERSAVDPLRYQSQPPIRRLAATVASPSGEWLTVKARFKMPEGEESELIAQAVRSGGRVQHLPLASAVAEFGLLLRDGARRDERWDALERRVSRLGTPVALAADVHEFAELVAIATGLARLR